jgi:DNA repair exonuclease SbcCD nuclease subunit
MYLTFESVLNRLEEDGVDFILLPGDLFDTRDLKPSVLSKTEDILSDVDVPVLVSPGNHDQRIYPREVTWLRYLHEKGHIILLESDLSEEVANFERGRFEGEVTEQEILKVFDAADEPVLTTQEVADELPISCDAVTYRLNKMHDEDLVGKKETGARAVAWWAKVAPELSDESKARVEESRADIEAGDTVPLEEA